MKKSTWVIVGIAIVAGALYYAKTRGLFDNLFPGTPVVDDDSDDLDAISLDADQAARDAAANDARGASLPMTAPTATTANVDDAQDVFSVLTR